MEGEIYFSFLEFWSIAEIGTLYVTFENAKVPKI